MDADREAHLEAVLAETVEPLRRFLARRTDTATAEDVLSETLLVCWRRREDLPVAPGEALPWAYAVARFCLANAERSARRRARLQAKVAASGAAPRRGPSLTTPEQARLADALAALGEDDAEVLRLWAWEQLTPAEIGTVSPSLTSPDSSASASGSCTAFWITRFSGRAPNTGS